jgi:hypothetical protein
MFHKGWQANTNHKAMDLLLNALVLIVCKRVPVDAGVTKIETLHNKVRILPPGVETKTMSAVVRLVPAMKNVSSMSVSNENAKQIEIDQEGRSVAMNGRHKDLQYSVAVINCYAASAVREDIVHCMAKTLPDFFRDESHQSKILNNAAYFCSKQEDEFI